MSVRSHRPKRLSRSAAGTAVFGLLLVVHLTANPQRTETTPSASAAIATPPTIPEQPLIRGIYNWRDDVAIITERWTSAGKAIHGLFTVDQRSSRIVHFRAISCDSYDDIGYSEQLGKIVVCRRQDGARLYRLTERGWTQFSDVVQGQDFRCAVDRERIVVISSDTVYLFSAASKKPASRISIAFAKVPEWTGPIVPAAALLGEDSILLAYDQGEFGGALYRVSLSEPTTPTKLLDDNVKFLARSPSGAIWAASSLGHLSVEHGALYRIDGATPEVVASVTGDSWSNKVTEKSGADFPELTDVRGLAFADSDRPIVVFPELGVFELAGDRFTARYRGTLFFTYRTSLRGIAVDVGSLPVGVVTMASGDLYVASRSLGIFWIRGNGSDARLKQLRFAAAIKPPKK